MDPSALIFIALAVAWAVYLIPKALEHHEESVRSRGVDRFSHRLRVLARREPVDRRQARLVSRRRRTPAVEVPPAISTEHADIVTPAQLRANRAAAKRAARRRRRVVALILVANLAVAAAAFLHYVAWVWVAVAAGLLVAWLVACRLMVRKERADRLVVRIPPSDDDRPGESTEEFDAVAAADEPLDAHDGGPARWDPVPVTLPTYVDQPMVTRSVRTIDLDSTGVWSSGRNAEDSALVREAQRAERTATATSPQRHAAGS